MQLPTLQGREELVQRYALLLEYFGAEMGQRPLVQQTAEFFPDSFQQDQPSVQRLVDRMSSHAGLQDIPIEVQLAESAAPVSASSCSSGGCGSASSPQSSALNRLEATPNGWRLQVATAELGHPGALASTLAVALGRVFLEETSHPGRQPQAPIEVTTELVCVGLGLGLLLIEGSYIYSKSCGGPSVSQLTKLSVGQLAIACALFIEGGQHSSRRARKQLSTTQRALLTEASAWASSNSKLLAPLRHSPALLTEGPLGLREARSWLAQILDKKSPDVEPDFSEDSLELALSAGMGDADLGVDGESGPKPSRKPKDPEREALAALVDEALRSS